MIKRATEGPIRSPAQSVCPEGCTSTEHVSLSVGVIAEALGHTGDVLGDGVTPFDSLIVVVERRHGKRRRVHRYLLCAEVVVG